MADVAPFRGLRYNRESIPELAEVVIPPYDVISPEEQKIFNDRSPYNMIRLELGMAFPGDTPEENPHTRAAAFIGQWEHQRILVRDPKPAIYLCELDYQSESETVKTRKGFICALKLEEFSGGKVRPHEKTFQAIKDERLSLMLACHANLSPVFGLYSDPENQVQAALEAHREGAGTLSFTDYANMTHRLTPVTDPGVIDRVRSLMDEKAIFIADGHHRYETALNYRNLMRERFGSGNPQSSFEYVMVYLAAMEQCGLTILPTHRLLRNLGDWDPAAFIKKAEDCFRVEHFNTSNGGELKWKNAIRSGGVRQELTIGFYCKASGCVYVLTAKPEAVLPLLEKKGIAEPLRTLDVVVLDQIVLRDLLGLSESFLASERNISFIHDFSETLDSVRSGRFDAGFFINPTRMEQVREVASAGHVMPHKSTYFYPKVISGLVVNPLSPYEEIFC